MSIKLSSKLILILNAVKKHSSGYNLEFIKCTFDKDYHYNQTYSTAIAHLVDVYMETLAIKEFKMGNTSIRIINLLLEIPVKHEPLSTMISENIEVSVIQCYENVINCICTELSLTNIGWCRDQLDL